jgi:hypothetical protein
MRAVLTPEDLKRGDLIEPMWYPVTISAYNEEVTKGSAQKPSDGSMNAIFTMKLDSGPNAGMELKRYFNEKALGFGKALYEAVGLPKNATGGYDLSTEVFQKFIGAKLEVYIKRGINNETKKEFNEIADFRKAKQ